MRKSVVLKFWQPVGVNAIMDFEANPHLRGCMFADSVGLGKTWTLIGYLLAVSTASVGLLKASPEGLYLLT
jgi:hypothetical protein